MRAIWIASIVLRVVAILCSRPSAWRAWAIFYTATGIILKIFDSMHYGAGYYWVWIAQQIGSAALLLGAVLECCAPDGLLAVLATFSAAFLSAAFYVRFNWPAAPLEYVMLMSGFILLAGGMFIACSLLRSFGIHRAILASYLLLSAVILFVAPEYLREKSIGTDVALLDCFAFGLWAWLFSVEGDCFAAPYSVR